MIKVSSTCKYPQTLLLLITLRVINSRDLANNLAGIRVLKKNANVLFARYNPYLDEL